MSVQHIPKQDVIKLAESTYILWKHQITLIIDGYGLTYYIIDNNNPPTQFVTSSARARVVNPEFVLYQRQDKLLASWLLSTVSADVLPHLTSCNTTKAIWSTITRMFSARSSAKTSALRHSLHTLKKGGLTIHEYLAKIKLICDSLNTAGSIVTEQEQVSVVLVGLSMEFESVIAIASREVMSLEALTDMLLDCEARQKLFLQETLPIHANMVVQQGSPTFDAAVTQGPHGTHDDMQSSDSKGQRGGGTYRGRGRGRYAQNRPQCQVCGRYGHVALKCWYRIAKNFQGPNSNSGIIFYSAWDTFWGLYNFSSFTWKLLIISNYTWRLHKCCG